MGSGILPSGDMLSSERGGSLLRFSRSGQLSAAIQDMPKIKKKGQGGLLGLALHPDFKHNNLVYFSYTAKKKVVMGPRLRAEFCGAIR